MKKNIRSLVKPRFGILYVIGFFTVVDFHWHWIAIVIFFLFAVLENILKGLIVSEAGESQSGDVSSSSKGFISTTKSSQEESKEEL